MGHYRAGRWDVALASETCLWDQSQWEGRLFQGQELYRSCFAFCSSVCCIICADENCGERGRFNLDWNMLCNGVALMVQKKQEYLGLTAQKKPAMLWRGLAVQHTAVTDTQLRPHQVYFVKELSDCHDSFPTGYELIWTYNTTALFLKKEPLHFCFSCFRRLSSECKRRINLIFLLVSESVQGCRSRRVCVTFILESLVFDWGGNRCTALQKGSKAAVKLWPWSKKEARSVECRVKLRGYHLSAMIIKSLQVSPPAPPPPLSVSMGSIRRSNVNNDESPRQLGGDGGLISLSLGEQAADDYRPQSSTAWLSRALINDSSSAELCAIEFCCLNICITYAATTRIHVDVSHVEVQTDIASGGWNNGADVVKR